MEGIYLFLMFFILIFLSVPIGFAIGIATVIAMVLFSEIPLAMVVQNAVTGVDSFPLMAIPFFILAGNIMSTGGVAKRIVDTANMAFGRFTGGLGAVTTAACMFFAAISGSAMATVSAIGGFMIPGMEEKGYSRSYSAALSAAAGTIGVIIPPSIPFVLYGVVVGASISDLFVAGFLPGISMGVALMIANYFLSKKYGYKGVPDDRTFKQKFMIFLDAVPALMTPVIILGGIYASIFTPTEAAAVACVYAIVVSLFWYKECTVKDLYKTFVDTMDVNGLTVFMVGLSTIFATYLSMRQIPQQIAGMILGITTNKYLLLLIINLFLLVVGCFIDNIPATIILAPILLPIVKNLGMSTTTFGIMLTMNLAIGFVTPPYGINLFVAAAVAKVKIGDMLKDLVWFIFALLVVLMLTTYFEPFTMFFLR